MNGSLLLKDKDGKFIYLGSEGSEPSTSMPYFLPDGKQIQFFISDYSLNSMVKVLHEGGNLMNSQSIPIQMIKNLFPNFDTVFGKDHFTVQSLMKMRKLNLVTSQEKISVDGSVEIQLMNPLNPSIPAAIINCNLTTDLTFSLDKSTRLVPHIKKLKLKDTDVFPLFYSEFSDKKL